MKPDDYLDAARVPERLKPQAFGPWSIKRWYASDIDRSKLSIKGQLDLAVALSRIGFDSYTLLQRWSWKSLHQDEPEVVMEDSCEELRKHLPIWLNAKGHVLVSGLGLGCVVRGLLANKDVEHITVLEIDRDILRIVGHEFRGNRKVTLMRTDALKAQFAPWCRFDYAWHDIWCDGDGLIGLHAKLLAKYARVVTNKQGAWDFPKWFRRRHPEQIL